jgi:hypothetical protein
MIMYVLYRYSKDILHIYNVKYLLKMKMYVVCV